MRDEILIQMRELFEAVVDLAPAERGRYLDANYPATSTVRLELERLLIHENAAATFLETPVLTTSGVLFHRPATLTGSHIGPYRIERELGRGGMGVVYLAVRDDEVFSKQVALKLVWPGLSHLAHRFRQERQMLADLEHPFIARLLDGGATPEGWQYLVMEYIEGVSLLEYCQQQNLSVPARLQLFLHVCAAVQHAHQHLIIHRDLKPGNILVTPEGQVKLLDFGIAKALDASAYRSDLSLPGTHLLTPEYASPEQLMGDAITTASDIYSLGVVLFELLTEQRPFDFPSRRPHEIARVLSQHAPPRMSQVIGMQYGERERPALRLSAHWGKLRSLTLTVLHPAPIASQLRGDLDNIVARALQFQPNNRYASVAQFSEDIRRHLNGEVVQARKPTLAYRAHRFVRQHKVAFSAGAAALLVLLLWLSFLARQIRVERAQAREQRQQLYAAEMKQALDAWQNNDFVQMQKTLARWQPQADEEDPRGFEYGYLQRLLNASSHTLQFQTALRSVDLLPQLNYLAVKLATEELKFFDINTGREVRSFPGGGSKYSEYNSGTLLRLHEPRKVVLTDLVTGAQMAEFTDAEDDIQSASISPGVQRLVTVAHNGTIKIRDSVTGAVLHKLPGNGQAPTSYIFHGGTRRLFTVWDERQVRIDFLQERRRPLEFSEPILIRKMLSDVGSQYLVTLTDQALTVRDILSGRIMSRQQGSVAITAINRVSDRTQLVTGSADGTLRIWALLPLRQIAILQGHTKEITRLGLTSDMQDLVSISIDRTLIWWDWQTKQKKAVLRGHTADIISHDFNRAMGKIATASHDRTVRIWDLHEVAKPELLTGHTDHILTVAFSPDGKHVASGGKDNTAILSDSHTGAQKILRGHQNFVYITRFSPDGRWLVTGSDDGTAKVWDVASGQELKSFYKGNRRYHDGVRSLTFLPNGQTLLMGNNDGTIIVWDVVTNRVKAQFQAHIKEILSLSLSPDGKLLASASADGPFKLWDTTTWQEKAAVPGHSGRTWTAVFSPDGQQLVTGSGDQTIKFWDVATMTLLRTLEGHNDGIFQVAFTPDGKRLASVSDDHTVKIWNPQTGQELLTLRDHTNEVWGVAFSPDGRTMLTGSWDKTLRLWRAVPKP